METRKVTLLGFLTATAMILSFAETQIPPFIPVPGIKPGLANAVIIIVICLFGAKEALLVNIVRILLTAFLFGNALSMLYGIVGALFSLFIMTLLYKSKKFSLITISICGGVFHNIGQIIVASFVLGSSEIFYYLPALLIAGIATGIIIGIIGGTAVKRIPPYA